MAKVFEAVPAIKPAEPDPKVGQSQLPEELKGKSADEVYAALSAEHNSITQAAELKHQTELAEARKLVVPEPKLRPAPTFTPPGEEEEPDFLTDQEGFMERQFNKRLAPLAQQTIESQRATNKEIFRGKVGNEEYAKYEEEIEDFIGRLHPMLQGNFKSYEAAYDYVRSRHFDEIADSMADKKATTKLMTILQKKGYGPEEIAQFIGSDEPSPKPAAPTGLFRPVTGLQQINDVKTVPFNPTTVKARVTDPQERKMMNEFGMTEEEYIEYRDQNTDMVSELTRRSK